MACPFVVSVHRVEKDPGFFALLRMTQKVRAMALSWMSAPSPDARSLASASPEGRGRDRGPSTSFGMTQKASAQHRRHLICGFHHSPRIARCLVCVAAEYSE